METHYVTQDYTSSSADQPSHHIEHYPDQRVFPPESMFGQVMGLKAETLLP